MGLKADELRGYGYGAGIYGAGDLWGRDPWGRDPWGRDLWGRDLWAGCGPAMGLERSRLRRMKERKWELMGQLEECKAACTQSHSSCVSLLLSLVSVRCRRRRVELRRHLYLQAKATAMLLKARLEELTLLLDTYSPEHVEAHGNIRSLLEAALSGSQLELASLRVTLGSYESLGPVMADAAQQYRDLRDRIHKPPLGPTAHGPHGDPPMRGSDVPIGCCGQTWLPIGCL
ncbi:HAUS augmin-like complex subunit 4 isoform X2 [Coturnix japonica]|uniref:HAUS augmin-like complex subunit 4 isoform X2 n=1 Tax=Coturnix japonica TaxID=93934 RepID=UPI000776FD95|nr:HAUS augmin-like complex subunit 4 isoform X2 [Coturnix japonica]